MANKRLSILRASCALVVGLAAPTMAFAQEESEEIVVTATKRTTSIQEVLRCLRSNDKEK